MLTNKVNSTSASCRGRLSRKKVSLAGPSIITLKVFMGLSSTYEFTPSNVLFIRNLSSMLFFFKLGDLTNESKVGLELTMPLPQTHTHTYTMKYWD